MLVINTGKVILSLCLILPDIPFVCVKNRNYVLEPSEKYANKSVVGSTEENCYVLTMFSPVHDHVVK